MSDPILLQHPKTTLVKEGSFTQLHCKVSGYPPPSYKWYFKNETIASAHQAYLLLNNISQKHEGLYQCEVANLFASLRSQDSFLQISCKFF